MPTPDSPNGISARPMPRAGRPGRRRRAPTGLVTALVMVAGTTGCDQISPPGSDSFGSAPRPPRPGEACCWTRRRSSTAPSNAAPIWPVRTVPARSATIGSHSADSRWRTPDLGLYNSRGALREFDDADKRFAIAACRGSGGEYAPHFFGARDGRPMVTARGGRGLRAGQEGCGQMWEGWHVDDGQIALCDRRWQVRADAPVMPGPAIDHAPASARPAPDTATPDAADPAPEYDDAGNTDHRQEN